MQFRQSFDRLRSFLLLYLAVAMALASPACESTHGLLTLTVDVQTDLVPSYEFAYVEVVVSDGAGGCDETLDGIYQRGRIAALGDARSFRTGLRVGEITDLSPGPYTVRATLRRPPADATASPDTGAVLVRRCIAMVVGSSRVVRVHLTSDCVAVECPAPGGSPAFTECLAGRCVDPRCDPADPSTYEDYCCDRRDSSIDCDAARFCLEDTDCVPAASCATARCDIDDGEEGGVCVTDEEIPGVCGPGTYCSREEGACVPIPMTNADAGVPIDAAFVGGLLDAPLDIEDAGIDTGSSDLDAPREAEDTGMMTSVRDDAWSPDPPDVGGPLMGSDAGADAPSGPMGECLDSTAVYTADGCVLSTIATCSPFMPCPTNYACQRLSDGRDRCVCSSPTVCGPRCTSSSECASADPSRPVCRRGACYPEFGCLGWWSSPIFCGVDETCGSFGAGCAASPIGARAIGDACTDDSQCASRACRRFSGFPSPVCVAQCTTTSDCSLGTCLTEGDEIAPGHPTCAPPATVPAGCAACAADQLCAPPRFGTDVECLDVCRTTSDCELGEVCRVSNARQYGVCTTSSVTCRSDEFMIDVDSGRSSACSSEVACVDSTDCPGTSTCQAWAFGGVSGMVTTCTLPLLGP